MKAFKNRLEESGCADAHHRELAEVLFHLAGLEVDVGQRIEFVDYDVDVVWADAVAETHYGFTLEGASDGMEFARRNLEGFRVEVLGHDVHAGRLPEKNP